MTEPTNGICPYCETPIGPDDATATVDVFVREDDEMTRPQRAHRRCADRADALLHRWGISA